MFDVLGPFGGSEKRRLVFIVEANLLEEVFNAPLSWSLDYS